MSIQNYMWKCFANLNTYSNGSMLQTSKIKSEMARALFYCQGAAIFNKLTKDACMEKDKKIQTNLEGEQNITYNMDIVLLNWATSSFSQILT